MLSLDKQIKYRLFEEAVRLGYCDIYSSHDIVEAAILQVAQRFTPKRKRKGADKICMNH